LLLPMLWLLTLLALVAFIIVVVADQARSAENIDCRTRLLARDEPTQIKTAPLGGLTLLGKPRLILWSSGVGTLYVSCPGVDRTPACFGAECPAPGQRVSKYSGE